MTAILHIKDSYYFEVPRAMWRSNRTSISEFPAFWVRLDPEFQDWEAQRIYDGLQGVAENLPPWEQLKAEYLAWRSLDANFAKPFDRFLTQAPSQKWFQVQLHKPEPAADGEKPAAPDQTNAKLIAQWPNILHKANNVEEFAQHHKWSQATLADYNAQLSGKILIPQPFGELRNLYQSESGFAISKFMVVEVFVAVIAIFLFARVAAMLRSSTVPRGRLANAFEAVLLYIRDEVARPAIGGHDADKFVPLLWTIFVFVLGCNLMGMLPWIGAPTGAFGVTLALAGIVFGTVIISGMIKFGPIGFWTNQVPHLGLPLYLALPIVPMIFVIEILGMVIKHLVLGVRLLANMVAGHLVLLGIMGLAFSLQGAASEHWEITAVIAILGSTLFSILELFVAFLQAYIFTFLSALFIGAAIHHH